MMEIRIARDEDLPALTQIYNHYVINSHCTFDVAPFSVETRATWFAQFDGSRHQCWVAIEGTEPVGYACSMPLRPKAAYATSVEVSVYLRHGLGGRGIGHLLYDALFESLRHQDVHRAYGLIAQPNQPSMRLHAKFGFAEVAKLEEVGRKFDRYWDVHWLQRRF